jgi:hypothetical protein
MDVNNYVKQLTDVYDVSIKRMLDLENTFQSNTNFIFVSLSGNGDKLIGELAQISQKAEHHVLISVLVGSDVPYHTLILSTLSKKAVSVHEVNLCQDKDGSVSLLSADSDEAWAIYNHVLKSVSKPSRKKMEAGLQRAMDNMTSLLKDAISIKLDEYDAISADFLNPDKIMR